MRRFWALGLLLAFLVGPAKAAELDFSESARIAIQSGGRKKPLDTFAAESLQLIHGRRSFREPGSETRTGAMDALFSMWFGTRDWQKIPVVVIPQASLRKQLGLSATERYFALSDLADNAELRNFSKTIQAKHAAGRELTPTEKDAEAVLVRVQQLAEILSGNALTVLPDPQHPKGNWQPVVQAAGLYGAPNAERLAASLKKVVDSYQSRDPAGFAASTRELRALLAGLAPANYPSAAEIGREVHYNHFHPFLWAWILYAASFFALLSRRGARVGTGLFAAGLLAHIYGLVLRCWIAGRPPVTNMYESVIWVSLGAAAFALVFAGIHRAKVYLLAAAPLSVLCLILADSFPSVLNPNISPLPPVLRDNFWLMIHVLTITLGYAAFLTAMGLAHVILGWYLFKPQSIHEESPIHTLLYRVIQIGILLLAAGTILGGVWANYSWGRFWGWDPKETWALIALLMYIFSLHGRLAGWWGNFGLAVAGAVCFNGVLMAWYGVNFVLGKGLHSYGFGGGGVQWVAAAVALDLVFVGTCIFFRMRRSRSRGAADGRKEILQEVHS